MSAACPSAVNAPASGPSHHACAKHRNLHGLPLWKADSLEVVSKAGAGAVKHPVPAGSEGTPRPGQGKRRNEGPASVVVGGEPEPSGGTHEHRRTRAAETLGALPRQPERRPCHSPRLADPHLLPVAGLNPAAVELAPGLWSTDGTTAALTAVAEDGLTLVETGEPVDGTITATLANEESLMWVQFGGADGKQVVVELAMRADRYAIRTRDSASPVFTEFDGVPTFEYNPDLVIEAAYQPYPEPVAIPIGTANPLVDGVHYSVGEVVFRLPGMDHEFRLQAEEEKLGALTMTFHDETNGEPDGRSGGRSPPPGPALMRWEPTSSWISTAPSIIPAPSPRTAPAPCR